MSAPLLQITEPPENTWPALVPLDAPDLPSLNLTQLPCWAGDYACALATATETPPELAASMVIVTCATAAARRLQVRVHSDYFEPCNLWTVVALPSGTRKSAVQSAATRPLSVWEHEQAASIQPEIKRITSERETMRARAKEMRTKAAKTNDENKSREFAERAAELEAELPTIPAEPQIWTSDATPEQLGSLLAEHEECMGWLSSEGGIFDLLQGRYSNGIPNLDLVLKSHSGDPERVNRQGRQAIFLQNPRLSIGLSPQPEVLHGLAHQSGFRGRGLLARFLYLLPPSSLGYRHLTPQPLPERTRDAYTAGIRAMLNWEPYINDRGITAPYTLQVSDEAYSEWQEFARSIERQMRAGDELEHFTDWGGKAPGAAIRIAGVLHGIKHAHERPWESNITLDTMKAAVDIMTVVKCHSTAAMDLMGVDPNVAAARKVWEWIESGRHAQFQIRDAFNALRGTFPRVNKVHEALSVLEERGYVVIVEPPRDGPGRPPSPIVRVRPEIVENWS